MEAISGPLTGDRLIEGNRTGPLNKGVTVVLNLRASSYSVEVLSRVTLVK